MLPEPTKDELHDLWEQLWSLRCDLDQKMRSDKAQMGDIKRLLSLANQVSMNLKALLDARAEPNAELLKEVRDACDFEEAA